MAQVCRDGQWQSVAAVDLVHGDLVHVRVGDIVPTGLQVSDGQILVDQSALNCRREGCDRVVCGAYPYAEIKAMEGIMYYNDGDWVESCTALIRVF